MGKNVRNNFLEPRASSGETGRRELLLEYHNMHKVPHPGEFIKEVCLLPLHLTITKAAHELGVTRKALSELLNGKTGISIEMALRLAKAFNTTPESWLTQQMNYDLWQAKKKKKQIEAEVKTLWKKQKHHDMHHPI
jgi:addiction module HigA family antidote